MSGREGWTRVTFGDVVRNISESVPDPRAAGLERAVGLEHLDPGELTVTRWASTADGLTFTRHFRAGQVLFGRRRAYQRKVAVPDFDGVCSGDIYVLEPSNDHLLPELLPFIVQSEPFFDYALRTSAGSLSPRTKWADLKKYTFDLPPIDEQLRIVELLSASEAVRNAQSSLVDQLVVAKRSIVDAAIGQGVERDLGDALDVCQYGLSLASSDKGQVPILGMTNVTDGSIDLSELSYVNLSAAEVARFRLEDRDVLFNRTNSVELVGRTGLYRGSGDVVFASYLIRLRPTSDLLPEFLNLFLNSSLGKRRVRSRLSKGVSQANISGTSIKATKIPVPGIDEQAAIVARAGELDAAVASARDQLTRLKALASALRFRELHAVH